MRNRPGRRRWPLIVLASILLIVVIVVILAVSSGSGSSGPAWRARAVRFAVISPAGLAVTAKVTNTGTKAATPECTVNASDPAGAYTGVDIFTLKDAVRPGRSAFFTGDLTITGEGARYVTKVTVTCS
jgi:hypothetical protein